MQIERTESIYCPVPMRFRAAIAEYASEFRNLPAFESAEHNHVWIGSLTSLSQAETEVAVNAVDPTDATFGNLRVYLNIDGRDCLGIEILSDGLTALQRVLQLPVDLPPHVPLAYSDELDIYEFDGIPLTLSGQECTLDRVVVEGSQSRRQYTMLGAGVGVDVEPIAKSTVPSPELRDKLNAVAEILLGVYGDDVLSLFGTGSDFLKAWDESKVQRHPAGSRDGGRFARKTGPEQVAAVQQAIQTALRGQRTDASAGELADNLMILTLPQLNELKRKYGISASASTKRALVQKLADRLDRGRRDDFSMNPVSVGSGVAYDVHDSRMLRLQAGDADAFNEIAAEWQKPIERFVMRQTRDLQQAEDITQDILLKIHEKAGEYTPDGKFKAWVFGMARNKMIDAGRRAKSRIRTVGGEDSEGRDIVSQAVGSGQGAAEIAGQSELFSTVDRILGKLPKEQREAFQMLNYDGLSIAEIAAATGATEGATKSRLRLAREKLREELAQVDDEYRGMVTKALTTGYDDLLRSLYAVRSLNAFDGLFGKSTNCGTGKGGFKPGNTCASGGKSEAAKPFLDVIDNIEDWSFDQIDDMIRPLGNKSKQEVLGIIEGLGFKHKPKSRKEAIQFIRELIINRKRSSRVSEAIRAEFKDGIPPIDDVPIFDDYDLHSVVDDMAGFDDFYLFENEEKQGTVESPKPDVPSVRTQTNRKRSIWDRMFGKSANCGTGAGGFQPGNTCGKETSGGRPVMPTKRKMKGLLSAYLQVTGDKRGAQKMIDEYQAIVGRKMKREGYDTVEEFAFQQVLSKLRKGKPETHRKVLRLFDPWFRGEVKLPKRSYELAKSMFAAAFGASVEAGSVFVKSASNEADKAELIADIIDWLQTDLTSFTKGFDESKVQRHPSGSREGGRFRSKAQIAVDTAKAELDGKLNGKRSAKSVQELTDILSKLTVKQLNDLKKQYQISASGRKKAELVAKIATRLDSGRRTEPETKNPSTKLKKDQSAKSFTEMFSHGDITNLRTLISTADIPKTGSWSKVRDSLYEKLGDLRDGEDVTFSESEFGNMRSIVSMSQMEGDAWGKVKEDLYSRIGEVWDSKTAAEPEFQLEQPRKERKKARFDAAPQGRQSALFDAGRNDLEGQNLLFNTDAGAGDDPTTMESKMKREPTYDYNGWKIRETGGKAEVEFGDNSYVDEYDNLDEAMYAVEEIQRDMGRSARHVPEFYQEDSSKSKLGNAVSRASMQYNIDPKELRSAVESVWEVHRENNRREESLKKDIRDTLRLTSSDISRIENWNLDHDSVEGFDEGVQELMTLYPEIGLTADPNDFVWQKLREGSMKPLPKHNPKIIDEAVSMVLSGQRSGGGVSVAMGDDEFNDWLMRSTFGRSGFFGKASAGQSDKAELIAEILTAIYGQTIVGTMFGADMSLKRWWAWDESEHPRDARGRFIHKDAGEVGAAIREALKSRKTAESARELAGMLMTMRVKDLQALKAEYKLSASGVKRELVQKLAERLDSGRRADYSAEPAPRDTPRGDAQHYYDSKRHEEYAWARESEVQNVGKDLLGSARHKRNEWRTLEELEERGAAVAEEAITRANLMARNPPNLAVFAESNPLTAVAMQLSLNSIPARPYGIKEGDVHRNLEKKKLARQLYVEAYNKLKAKAEYLAENESDPIRAMDEFSKEVDAIRGTYDYRKGTYVLEQFNNMVHLSNRTRVALWRGGLIDIEREPNRHDKKVEASTQIRMFAKLAKDTYGENWRDDPKTVEAAIEVVSGKTVEKAFGVKRESTDSKGYKFDPSEAYITGVTERVGGKAVSQNTADAQSLLVKSMSVAGLQYGNSMTDDERYHHTVKTAESLVDLADVLKIPDSAVGAGGKLGLAFGARGRAGAKAHYEPDSKVINLTRKTGAGSLAHEWAHFMDNHLGQEKNKYTGSYLTQSITPEVSELHSAWANASNRIAVSVAEKYSGWSADVRMKQVRYWTSPVELFARYTERYVQTELNKSNRENSYLVGLQKKTHPWWPSDAELEKAKPALEKVYAKYREMFSGSVSTGSRDSRVQKMVGVMLKQSNAFDTLFGKSTSELKIELIAEILVAIYGESVFSDNEFIKRWWSWNEADHPRDERGRFVAKETSIAEARTAIDNVLRGRKTPDSAKELADILNGLSVKELKSLKAEYAISASGVKRELVDKLAARLDSGRRADFSMEPVKGTDNGQRNSGPDDGRSDSGSIDAGVGAREFKEGRILLDREQHHKPATAEELARIPDGLREHLNEAQREGVAKAISAVDRFGGFLLADGTGVGKSRQLLGIANRYALDGKKVVIVAPSEVIKPDWKKNKVSGSYSHDGELMGVTPKLQKGDVKLVPGQVAITSYNELGKLKSQVDGDTIVLFDESHALKNSNSQRGKDGRDVSFNAGGVVYATATPGDKALHLGHLIRAGVFGGGDPSSRKFFGKAEDTYRELGLRKETFYNRYAGREITKWAVDPKVGTAEVTRRISGLFDQMTKDGLMIQRSLSMDNVAIQSSEISLPDNIRQSVDSTFKQVMQETDGNKAVALMAMRRSQEPHKIPATVKHIQQELASGRAPIVFLGRVNDNIDDESDDDDYTPDENTSRMLKTALIEAGVPESSIGELHGAATKTADQKRKAMTDFNSGKKSVLISTIQSGGTGVNLDDTVGDRPRTVIMMTPPLSANDMVQAAGRINRLSTKSDAKIINITSDHEIDQWNMRLLSGKMATLGAVNDKPLENLIGGESVDRSEPYQWSRPLIREKAKPTSTVPAQASTGSTAPATSGKPATASFAKLRDGSWGLRVVGDVKPGDFVTVTRRDGKTDKKQVSSIVRAFPDATLVTFKSLSTWFDTLFGKGMSTLSGEAGGFLVKCGCGGDDAEECTCDGVQKCEGMQDCPCERKDMVRRAFDRLFVKNCGTGAGGFQPGNTCGKGGDIAEQIRRGKQLYEISDPSSASELVDIVREVSGQGKARLQEFADAIGMTVYGSKAEMVRQMESMINRRSVSHVQTHTLPPSVGIAESAELPEFEPYVGGRNNTSLTPVGVTPKAVTEASLLFAESTPESAAKLMGMITAAAKRGRDNVKAIADEIGITVNGSKADMLRQLKFVIERRSVSHMQTRPFGKSTNCGTGAGGFKPGNTCAVEDGEPEVKVSSKRMESLKREADAIEITDEVWGDDEFDFNRVLSSLSVDEEHELESYIDDQIEEYLMYIELDVDISQRDVVEESGWTDDTVRERLHESLNDDEQITEAIDSWWRNSGNIGVDALEEFREELRDSDLLTDEIDSSIDSLVSTAESDIESALQRLTEEAEDELRQQYRDEYDSSEDRYEWVRSYWENNQSKFLAEARLDVWGRDGAGDSVYKFDTDNGEYTIDVVEKKQNGVMYKNVSFTDSRGSYAETGKAGAKTAFQVFGKVAVAMTAYVERGIDEPMPFNFSAHTESRQRIYERLTRTIALANPEYVAYSIDRANDWKDYYVVPRSQVEGFMRVVGVDKDKLQTVSKSVKPKEQKSGKLRKLKPATEAEVQTWLTDESAWEPKGE